MSEPLVCHEDEPFLAGQAEYFRTDLRQTSRIILVVLEKKYTLEEVMNIARISGDRFGPPSPLFQTKSASLYELHELALSSQQAGYTAVR